MPTFYQLDRIEIGSRQRSSDLKAADIDALAESIARDGQLNPICVLRTAPGQGRLVAGWRRYNAIKQLHEQKVRFFHGTMDVSPGCIAVTELSRSDSLALLRAEFSENKERLPLSWQEENAALAMIYEEEQKAAPGLTQIGLAEQLAPKLDKTVSTVRKDLSQAVQLKAAIERQPELAKARNAPEAMKMLRRQRHDSLEAELAKRQFKTAAEDAETTQTWDLTLGDCREVLVGLETASVDLILVDPPYGKDIDTMKYAPNQMHRYDDSLASAMDLAQFIIQESWRLTRPKANLFLFCDWENFALLRQAAARTGWDPWFRPIIWNKSLTEGAAPWGRQGFLNTYECLLWATKGQLGIKGPLPDVLYSQKVGVVNRDHAAEKPLELLLQLIRLSTEPNGVVLDPCAGSGSTLDAAIRLRRRCLGVELDEVYFNRAMGRLGQLSAAMKTNPELEVK